MLSTLYILLVPRTLSWNLVYFPHIGCQNRQVPNRWNACFREKELLNDMKYFFKHFRYVGNKHKNTENAHFFVKFFFFFSLSSQRTFSMRFNAFCNELLSSNIECFPCILLFCCLTGWKKSKDMFLFPIFHMHFGALVPKIMKKKFVLFPHIAWY